MECVWVIALSAHRYRALYITSSKQTQCRKMQLLLIGDFAARLIYRWKGMKNGTMHCRCHQNGTKSKIAVTNHSKVEWWNRIVIHWRQQYGIWQVHYSPVDGFDRWRKWNSLSDLNSICRASRRHRFSKRGKLAVSGERQINLAELSECNFHRVMDAAFLNPIRGGKRTTKNKNQNE